MCGDHPNPVDAYVGGRLRLVRNSKGKTRLDLAKELNISVQLLGEMEGGIKRIPPERIRKLAQIFGIKSSFFFAGIDNLTTKPPIQ